MSEENQTEFNDFLNAMGDVKPARAEQRVHLKKNSVPACSVKVRREAAEALPTVSADPLIESIESDMKPLDPYSVLEFRRDGVQHGVYKKLRLGHYPHEARLDLHRMTVEQARRSVYQFIRDCISHDIRCALITHGKGEGRKKPAVLKTCVAQWLPQINEVLAFYSARPQHGGTGSCYILLKKSAKKRLENLEMHQKKHHPG